MLQVSHYCFSWGYVLPDFGVLFAFNWFLYISEFKFIHTTQIFFRVTWDVLENTFLTVRSDAFYIVIKISPGWDQVFCILHYIVVFELWRILNSPGLIRVRQEPAAWVPIAVHFRLSLSNLLFQLFLYYNKLLPCFDFVETSQVPICNWC